MSEKKPSVCADCVHAEWHKTAAGKLHPSGEGRCKWTVSIPFARSCQVPPSRHIRNDTLTLNGGRVERWQSKFRIGEELCAVKEPAQ